MRSARAIGPAITATFALVALAGCVTTQQRNARAALRATRLLASRRPVVVTHPNRDVRVTQVELLRSAAGAAVVVGLANASPKVLTDLPISVGFRAGGRRTFLNRRGGLEYFQTHLASIGPRGQTAWVFATRRRMPAGARPFALVGSPSVPPMSQGDDLPAIVAEPLTSGPAARLVRVRVHNPTQIPQYGLPVYALARRGARYVAAGRTTLADLGTNTTAIIGLKLIGSTRRASLRLEALPTIFR